MGGIHVVFFGSEALKRELYDVESLTEERLDEMAAMFVDDLEAGPWRREGGPLVSRRRTWCPRRR